MRTEGNRETYTTIWLWRDLCQSPLLLPDGKGGKRGVNFPCAESQIVASREIGGGSVALRLASGDLIIKPSALAAAAAAAPISPF